MHAAHLFTQQRRAEAAKLKAEKEEAEKLRQEVAKAARHQSAEEKRRANLARINAFRLSQGRAPRGGEHAIMARPRVRHAQSQAAGCSTRPIIIDSD